MNSNSLLDSINIAPRFEHASFENYQPINKAAQHNLKICQSYVQTWKECKVAGEGIIMCGRLGTGKTHLAVATCREIVTQNGISAFITTASRIIRAFRRSWSNDADTNEFETLRFYSELDLLIIDEIGVQYGTESERNILFEVINNRIETW
ncbi:ATP-binding protein [Photorhabdus laumondii]|uniref:ATP-binding protein n=1 Tax=Photorhabdus laumondii TaxID=2218628 RepID=UPI001F4E910C|nr:ATP-binding protein [Photorhabdus laumondii]